MKQFKWVWAHTEDSLAVLRTPNYYARVFHNGSTYSYEVMTKAEYNNYCLGYNYLCEAEGYMQTHNEAREEVEGVLAQLA